MAEKVAKRGNRIQSKKTIKHLLERQRRARINHSLNELKCLVLSSIHVGSPNSDLNGFEKMEKAEILELTVDYIKTIQSRSSPGFWVNSSKDDGTSGCKQNGNYADEQNKKPKRFDTTTSTATQPYFSSYASQPLTHSHCQIPFQGPLGMDSQTACFCYCCTQTTLPPGSREQATSSCLTHAEFHTPQKASRGARASDHTSHSVDTKAGQLWRPW